MRMPGLDLLRAVAVVWTMLFHSFLVGGLGEHWAWAQRYGWMGVDLFFVLSGFLIGSQVLKPMPASALRSAISISVAPSGFCRRSSPYWRCTCCGRISARRRGWSHGGSSSGSS